MLLQGIAVTLITGLLWSMVGIAYSRAAERAEGFGLFLFASSLIFVLVSWGATPPASAPATEILAVAAIMIPAGIASQCGFLMLREAMRRGSHGISWGIAQSAMLCPFAAGLLLFGEHASWLRITGMVLLLCCLVPLSCSGKAESPGKSHRIFLLYAFLAFFLLGFQQTLTLIPNRLPELSNAGLSWRVPLFSLCGLGWIVAVRRTGRAVLKVTLLNALLYGLLSAAGQWTMFQALDLLSGAGAAGIAYPIAIGSCIALFFLYTVLIRKEKSSPAGIAGILLAIAGILLLAF